MRLCEQLSAAVDILKPHGLAAGFHNHQTEWAPVAGERRVMDIIAANTPKEFVLQLDVGTCVEAGADPVAWIKANPGRIKVLHLKDWAPARARTRRVIELCLAKVFRPGRKSSPPAKRWAEWSIT